MSISCLPGSTACFGNGLRTLRWLVPLVLALVVVARPAAAYTPESPEVRKLIDSGLAYLDKNSREERLGGKCLIALAFLKDDRGDHRFIAEAVKACEQTMAKREITEDYAYSYGLAVIFLSELDAKKHRKTIDFYLGVMNSRQKSHGGWGYASEQIGDISQSQYGTLSLWEAYQKGIPVNGSDIERAARWLITVQEPSGAWSYKPSVGPDGKHQPGGHTTPSTVAAGMGSLLICADLAGIIAPSPAQEEESALPGAVRVQSARNANRPRVSTNIDRKALLEAVKRGNTWMDKNFAIKIDNYTSYYLYALERYKSLQEELEGQDVYEPEWYNKGVEHLIEDQHEEGWWSTGCGVDCDTAFSVLFLLRSMKKSLGSLGDGFALGGIGDLPNDLSKLKVRGDRIVTEAPRTEVKALISMLDDEEKLADIESLLRDPSALVVEDVNEKDLLRLRQLVRSGDPLPRLLAIKALGKMSDLDNVPTLIYAMTLEDRRTVLEARDALRFVSRRFDGFGLSDNYDERQKFDAIEKWKTWYKSVRPDAPLVVE